MKIVVLSKNSKLYSTKRLVEAGNARGHDISVQNYTKCYIDITAKRPRIMYRDEPIKGVKAVIPRIASSGESSFGCAIVRQFEMAHVYCANASQAIARAGDKLRSLQLLSRKDVDLPVTGFANSTVATDSLIDMVGGPPLVIKLLQGSQGAGVVLAPSRKAAEAVISAFQQLKANFLVQEFVKEADGKDIRAFVVGGKVVAAMERSAPEGDFRSNLHRGGSANKVHLKKSEREMAIKAAQAMRLNIAGVDLIRSSRGPLVLEVNASPGLEGIENTTGVDVAGKIIEFTEKEVQSAAKRKRDRRPDA